MLSQVVFYCSILSIFSEFAYCSEGSENTCLYLFSSCRMLVYEYVNNGNLEQWLHGAMCQHGTLTWEARMKVLLGTAKA